MITLSLQQAIWLLGLPWVLWLGMVVAWLGLKVRIEQLKTARDAAEIRASRAQRETYDLRAELREDGDEWKLGA